ncbi:MAG TPA: nucleoside hydrolase [Rhodopila sp.]|uniref:nucleoside hydrolase n=1 Tax=Rhodopila sp. TaxID=2480087 RepID=UPI002C349A57|nr:nucleoside hydrolase [Rhodopila sp.]HVY16437.1 nucleoside hydrolase [Rhodopila sp.]
MPRPVIIDCDPGTDDAVALLLAFASPELDVRAVTVAGGNVGLARTLANALALTRLAGVSVPVHAGADRPLLGAFTGEPRVHGPDGLGGIVLPPGGAPAPGIAADAIRAILRQSADPVTLVGIGPATNLALALATEPALAERVAAIALMSGAWAEGNVTPAAEFNAWSDPEALAILLAAGRPVTFATLELTAQALATPERIAQWRAKGTGRCLAAACDIQASVPPSQRLGGRGAPLHDPCAVLCLTHPRLFTSRPAHVQVELAAGISRGRTVMNRWGGVPNARVLDTLDADGFFAVLGERLATLP